MEKKLLCMLLTMSMCTGLLPMTVVRADDLSYNTSIAEASVQNEVFIQDDITDISIFVTDGPYFTEGDIVTVIAEPDPGYELNQLTAMKLDGTGETITITAGENNTYTFVMPACGVSIGATCNKAKYTIDTTSSVNNATATATIGLKEVTVAELGNYVTLTVTAAKGYIVKNVSLDDAYTSLTDRGNGKYTFYMPAKNVKVIVETEKEPTVHGYIHTYGNGAVLNLFCRGDVYGSYYRDKNCDCTNINSSMLSVTIEAPKGDLTYDGTGKAATLKYNEDSADIDGNGVLDDNDWIAMKSGHGNNPAYGPQILYRVGTLVDGQIQYGEKEEPYAVPVAAGYYQAELTENGATASVTFEINKTDISSIKLTNGTVLYAADEAEKVPEIEIIAPEITAYGVTVNGEAEVVEGTYQWYADEACTTELTSWTGVTAAYWKFESGNGSYDAKPVIGKVTVAENALPELLGTVTLSGNEQYASPIRAIVTDLPAGATAKYQWYSGETVIEGATADTYTPLAADIGNSIKVVVTADGFDGQLTAESGIIKKATCYHYYNTSAKTVKVGDHYPAEEAAVGRVYYNSGWDEKVEGTIKWYMDRECTVPVSSTMTFDTVGEVSLWARFWPTDTTKFSTEGYGLISNVKFKVEAADTLFLSGTVLIEGINKVGETLTATATLDVPEGTAVIYKWYLSGAASSEEPLTTGQTYTLGAKDIGKTFRVDVTAEGYEGVVSYTYSNSIVKKDGPAAPATVSGLGPETENGNGWLVGTTTDMEYDTDTNFFNAMTCNAEKTSVTPGTYFVRYKVDDTTTYPGDCAIVYVPDYGYPMSVHCNAGGGAQTTQAGPTSPVIVTITPDEGYVLETVTYSYLDDEGSSVTTPLETTDNGDGTLTASFTRPVNKAVTVNVVFVKENVTPITSWLDCVEGDIPFRKAVNPNSEKWIDRIDLPVFAVDFYNGLVEATNGDGIKDYLMESSSFDLETTPLEVLEVDDQESIISMKMVSVVLNEEGIENKGLVIDALSDYLGAAYNAFDKDHPDVFWLTNGLSRSITSGVDENDKYVVDIYMDVALYYNGYLDANNDKRLPQFINEKNALYVDGEYIGQPDDLTSTKDIAALPGNLAKGIVDDFGNQLAGFEKHLKDNGLISGDVSLEGTTFDKLTDAGKIAYFDYWLTANNNYNSYFVDSSAPEIDKDGALDAYSIRECISALLGKTGEYGPVCEAYARALKVLCDSQNIGCVLVEGTYGGPHLWNYVQVDDGKWYIVDTTQNEGGPVNKGVASLNGNENTEKLLVGRSTTSEYIVENNAWSSISYLDAPAIQQNDFVFADSWLWKKVTSTGEMGDVMSYSYCEKDAVVVTADKSITEPVYAILASYKDGKMAAMEMVKLEKGQEGTLSLKDWGEEVKLLAVSSDHEPLCSAEKLK